MGRNSSNVQHPGWRARALQLWGTIRSRAQPKPVPVSIYRRIILFVAATVLTSMLIGCLPAGYALWQAFEQQIQMRLEQAALSTQALYLAERDASLKGISLVARRPALCELLASGDERRLEAYLDTLRSDLPAQALLVLPEGKPPLVSGATPFADVQLHLNGRSLPFADFMPIGAPPFLAILAASRMENRQDCPATVAIVEALDSTFMHSLSSRTGLQQSLIVAGRRIATSLPSAPEWPLDPQAAEEVARTLNSCCTQASSQSEHYYVSITPLMDRQNRLAALSEVALPTNAIRRQMQLILGLYAGSILLLALSGALASAALTRRIIQPLQLLSDAAEQIGSGELDHPLPAQSGWLELDHLAARLDDSRKQLRSRYERTLNETRRFALLLNAVPAGIVTLNESGEITWLNPEAEQLLGCSLVAALRRHFRELFVPARGAELTLDDMLSRKEDTLVPQQLRLIDSRDNPFSLAVTTAWLEDAQSPNHRREWVLVMREVSEDKASERIRARYLATLAHEFRTPLSSILASTELLVDELPEMSPDEAANLVNAARLSTLHLQALVNNILESATIESGAFQLRCRPVIFQEILKQAAQILAPLITRREQQLAIDSPPDSIGMWLDPDRINQVFVNLIGNASKFSPKGARIVVSVRVDGNALLVSVSDNGPGFPGGQIDKLFAGTFAASAPSGATQGIGLGLPIVKTIIQAHGGQVGAENLPGGGARVWFTLPRTGLALARTDRPQTEESA